MRKLYVPGGLFVLLSLLLVAGSITFSSDVLAQNNLTVQGAFSVEDRILTVDISSHGEYYSVSSALNAIGTTYPAADANTRYLIKVAPGTYYGQVVMKPYVDIEGSGRGMTILRYTGNVSYLNAYTVKGADNAELRTLTVQSDSSSSFNIGILNDGAAPTIRDIDIDIAPGSGSGMGIYNINNAAPTVVNVDITTTGGGGTYGVWNLSGSDMTAANLTAVVSGGTASHWGIYVASAGSTFVGTNVNVSATATGGQAYGLFASGNAQATITGGAFDTASVSDNTDAVYAYDNSAVTLTGVSLSSAGGTTAVALLLGDSDATASNVTATASGGSSSSRGLSAGALSGSYQVGATDSTFYGESYSVAGDDEFTMDFVTSRLDGAISAGGGTLSCLHTLDTSGDVLGPACSDLGKTISFLDMNIIWVAPSGGDFPTILAALTAIGTTLPAASSSNRYVIRVAPGTYTEQVWMESYVDIEGSGQEMTIITQPGGPAAFDSTVVSASNAELRNLKVINTGGDAYANGILVNGGNLVIRDVTVEASGGTSNNRGVINFLGSPTLIDVTTTATGGGTSWNAGVENFDAVNITMRGVIATASGGSFSDGMFNSNCSVSCLVYAENSSFKGASTSVYNNTNYGTFIGGSMLSGAVYNGVSAVISCGESYDSLYFPLAYTCVAPGSLLPPDPRAQQSGESAEPPLLPAPPDESESVAPGEAGAGQPPVLPTPGE